MSSDQIGEALEQPIPDVIEPIIGYRSWMWDDQGLHSQRDTDWRPGVVLKAECKSVIAMGGKVRLASTPTGQVEVKVDPPANPCATSPSDPWKPSPEAEAERCVIATDPDHVPLHDQKDPLHGEFGCGIYAYSTIEDAWANLHRISMTRFVLGEVQLWGRVWPHEHGYRAEFAKPVALYRPTRAYRPTIFGDPIDALAAHYRLEVKDLPLSEDERRRIAEKADEKYHASLKSTLVGPSHLFSPAVSLTAGSLYHQMNEQMFGKCGVCSDCKKKGTS